MSAIVHQDLIDNYELDSLLQRLTTAQNDKELLRHLKTAARNYTFDGAQIARLLAPIPRPPWEPELQLPRDVVGSTLRSVPRPFPRGS